MRWLALAFLATLTTSAYADTHGYFVSESIGGEGYLGELSRFDGAARLQVGIDVRRGPWTVEGFMAFTMPDLGYVDCYGEECAYAAKPVASFGRFGVDLRKRLHLLSLRRISKPGVYERPGVFVALHGGPRWVIGGDALDGYQGLGLGAGAALEGDLWVLGYYVDVGLEVMTLNGPGDTLHGTAPYLAIGVKYGWL